MVIIDPSSFIFTKQNIAQISNEIPFIGKQQMGEVSKKEEPLVSTQPTKDSKKEDQFVSIQQTQDSKPKPQVQLQPHRQTQGQSYYKQRQETFQADQNEKNVFNFLTESFKNLVSKLGVGNSKENNLISAVLNSILPNLEKMAGKSVDLTKSFINTMTKMFSSLENKALKSSPLKGEEKNLDPIQNLMINMEEALTSRIMPK